MVNKNIKIILFKNVLVTPKQKSMSKTKIILLKFTTKKLIFVNSLFKKVTY